MAPSAAPRDGNKADAHGLSKLYEQYAAALGERIVAAGEEEGASLSLSLRGERLLCALGQAEHAEALALEVAALQLAVRESRLRLQSVRTRAESFWAKAAALQDDSAVQLEELRLARRMRLSEIESDLLQPLT
eukprot:215866-Prymnesium_polylepis.1